jgi:circadian clock protein KaiA
LRSSLSLCILHPTDALAQLLSPAQLFRSSSGEAAGDDSASFRRYASKTFTSAEDLLEYIRGSEHPVDCLILPVFPELQTLFDQLQQQALFFPTVVVDPLPRSKTGDSAQETMPHQFSYHPAVILLTRAQINQIELTIDQAISKFLQLSPASSIASDLTVLSTSPTHRLVAQQLRLAEKLKERLDYLGVYYKRNPSNFLRRMTPSQKEELLQQLSADYRAIILSYFTEEPTLNDKIDQFVNVAFFADVPIAQVVAIHMDLMDEFSKQLKLEGRSDEILLDYRLTLIDTLAHLCEMYRRSIPRES